MRTRTLGLYSAMACVCAIIMAAEGTDTDAARPAAEPAVSQTVQTASPEEIRMPLPMPLPRGVTIKRHMAGGEDIGSTAGLEPIVAYSNKLGQWVFGPAGGLATSRIADDIALTCLHGGELVDYTVMVSGDRTGTGTTAPFDVLSVALYKNCPGADNENSIPIPGTEKTFTGLAGDELHELTIRPDGFIELPASLYLGVKFSRDNCGIVVGSPPTVGFSADLFDFPGYACGAWLGGYPEAAHASFYAEIRIRAGTCDPGFVGYKNIYHAGGFYSEGADIFFADDFDLGVPTCNMVAYDVAVKGNGLIEFALHRQLCHNDPRLCGRIPGTFKRFLAFGGHAQVARFTFPEPIPLPPLLWIVFRTVQGDAAGPVVTNQDAALGHSEDHYLYYDESLTPPDWVPTTFHNNNPYAAFDLTIYCAGEPPLGACCDLINTDENGDALCRELPEMNCGTADSVAGFFGLWRSGEICGAKCEGGIADGVACVDDTDCSFCDGGENGGTCRDGTCVGGPFPGGECANNGECSSPCLTQEDCPDDSGMCVQLICEGGPRPGEPCFSHFECTEVGFCAGSCGGHFCEGGENGGLCRDGICMGGPFPGRECAMTPAPDNDQCSLPCDRQADCPGHFCLRGPTDRIGQLCDPDIPDDCGEGGYCKRAECSGPFLNPCGHSACCTFEQGCINLTARECVFLEPIPDPRLYYIGDFCSQGGFRCPRGACFGREGECSLPRPNLCQGGAVLEPPPDPVCDIDDDCDQCREGHFCQGGSLQGERCETDQECGRCEPGDVCVCDGGEHDGEPCTVDEHCGDVGICVGSCDIDVCVCYLGDNDNLPCLRDRDCPDGDCRGFCQNFQGCKNPFCCEAVCQFDAICCDPDGRWDEICAANAINFCDVRPANDDCWSDDPDEGARSVRMLSITESDHLHATASFSDPGFCCHNGPECPGGECIGNPPPSDPTDGFCKGGLLDGERCDPSLGVGSQAFATVWYKFVATETSARVNTCLSQAPAEDSLLSVYAVADPNRGLCADGSPCTVDIGFCHDVSGELSCVGGPNQGESCTSDDDCTEDACADGFRCQLDERFACENLALLGCSDDARFCSDSERNAEVCVRGLTPGDTYYVMVGSKRDPQVLWEPLVTYKLRVVAPCSPTDPPMPNDYCHTAFTLSGPNVERHFDLSGGGIYAPATFHCPGEECVEAFLKNDIWYDWTAPGDGTAKISTCDPTLPPLDQPNTSMVVYRGCECPWQVDSAIKCNVGKLDECGLAAYFTIPVEAGQCYKIRVGGHVGSEEIADLRINFTPSQCPVGPITFEDPPSGVIDARQPHPPTNTAVQQGIDSLIVQAPPPPGRLDDPACGWTLCETGEDGRGPNDIVGVVDNGDGTFTVNLLRTISVGQVTTVTFTDGNLVDHTGVFTSQPADVNADRTSADPADVLAHIDCCLNQVCDPPWELHRMIYSCDVDHSGGEGPADILRVLDLLNGAHDFAPWLGVTAPDCGGCCPP